MASPSRTMGGLLVIAVALSVIGGLIMVGPPSDERARRQDNRRVQDLATISLAVDRYFSRTGTLPESLQQLDRTRDGAVRVEDSFTGTAYEYRRVDSTGFELCAVFEREALVTEHVNFDRNWPHGTGRQCFSRVARKLKE